MKSTIKRSMVIQKMIGYLYSLISRALHRFDLHYMRRLPVIEKDKQQIWCEWCGARYTYYTGLGL